MGCCGTKEEGARGPRDEEEKRRQLDHPLLADEQAGEDGGSPPLAGVGGVRSLSIRNVEHWHYDVGGHLDNDTHHDGGSIVTIVCALDGDYDGGVFRTFEEDGTHLEHPMEAGDCVCFVSHKYHNVTPVKAGRRRVMVIELWQGGSEHTGR